MAIGKLTVITPELNVRTEPNTVGTPIGVLSKGSSVEVIQDLNGWYEIVVVPATRSGFVSSNPNYVRFEPTTGTPNEVPSIRLIATVNVRSGPSASSEDIGDAEADSEFEVIATVGNWFKIRWNDSYAFITASPKYHVDAERERHARQTAEDASERAPARATDSAPLHWKPRAGLQPPAPDAALPLDARMLGATSQPTAPILTVDEFRASLAGGRVRTPEEFAVAHQFIATLSPDEQGDYFEALTLYTPYFSQRDNDAREGSDRWGTSLLETKGGRMCNITSLAMNLFRQGCRPPGAQLQPEDRLEAIRAASNFGPRTTYQGWGRLAESQGMKLSWLKNSPDVCRFDWWASEPRSYLRRGYALMASITGHIVAVVGIGDDRIYVHDPYGSNVLLAGGNLRWLGFNTYDTAGGVTQSTVGRWLSHSRSELETHRWNWVIAMRNVRFGGV